MPLNCYVTPASCHHSDSHELRSEVVDQRAQSHTGPPGLGQIFDVHVVIARRVILAPLQQLLKAAD